MIGNPGQMKALTWANFYTYINREKYLYEASHYSAGNSSNQSQVSSDQDPAPNGNRDCTINAFVHHHHRPLAPLYPSFRIDTAFKHEKLWGIHLNNERIQDLMCVLPDRCILMIGYEQKHRSNRMRPRLATVNQTVCSATANKSEWTALLLPASF